MELAKKELKEFWETAHKTYGDDIRLGLSLTDTQRLLALEKKLEQVTTRRVQHAAARPKLPILAQ